MNKTYRVIWSAALSKWVVASELATSKGKSKMRSAAQSAVCVAGFGLAMASGQSLASYAAGGSSAAGLNDTAVGQNALADSTCVINPGAGDYASAFGYYASAVGGGASAFGSGAVAGTIGDCSIVNTTAIGAGALATGLNSTALGNAASATGTNTVALGNDAIAAGANSTALGQSAQALSDGSVAVGTGSSVTSGSRNGVAIGSNAKIVGSVANSVSIGNGSSVSAAAATAIGANANVGTGATGAFSLGSSASVGMNASGSSAIGQNALVNAGVKQAVALGAGSVADEDSVVSVGKQGSERRVINVAPGVKSTDAVNVSQLTTETNNAIGGLTVQINNGQVGLVRQANPGANLTVGASTDGTAVDFASNSGTRQLKNVSEADANTDAVNFGQLKSYVAANGPGLAVVYDDATKQRVTLGNAGAPVVLDKVAAGSLASGSLEAVNGSQLNAAAQSVADALGGGATFNASTGTVTKPTYVLTDVNGSLIYNNVGDALDNLDGRVLGNTTNITNLTNDLKQGKIGLVQQAAAGSNLTVGAATDGVAVDFADKNGKTRTLANVTAGVQANDAVNVSQLTTAAQSVAKALGGNATFDASTGTVTAPTYVLTDVQGSHIYNNVGDALDDLDGRVLGNSTNITNLTDDLNQGKIGLVQQAAAGSNLTVGAATDGVAVDFADQNGKTRTLANVTAGVDANDAVNVSQLTTAGQSVADALGGGASFDASTGTVTAPSYELKDESGNAETFNNVGDALSQIDGRVANNTTNISNLTNQLNQGQIGLVQQAAAGENLTVGKDTDGEAVDFADKSGNSRTLKNVTAGVDDNDAVNVSQLTTAGQSVADALGGGATFDASTGTVTAPSYELKDESGHAETFNNVGDALSQIDGRVANNTTNISNLTNQLNQGQIGLVQQAAPGQNLTVGAATDGVAVDFADVNGDTRTLKNVTAGVEDTDAVNVSQLKDAGLIDSNGNALAAVTYDQNADGSPNLGSITLGKGGAPVSLKNVADGIDDNDAVNVKQLKGVGLIDNNGNLMDAVVYDPGMNRGQVTLGGVGAAPVVLTNVQDGQNHYDAVNFGQLSGLRGELMGHITNIDSRVTILEEGGVGIPQPLDFLAGNAGPSVNNAANAGETAGVALGYNSVAAGDNASALGHHAEAMGTFGLAAGNDSHAGGDNGTALGGKAEAFSNGGTAVGANSTVTVEATNAVALGAGSVANQANSVSVGAAGAERTVTNVAAGVNATDAVNVSQLNAMSDWAQNYTDQAFNALSRSINKTQRRASAGTASAIAMANMPQAYQPNMNTVSAGVGTFNGQNAISVGMTGITENGHWILRAGLTANSQGDKGAGMGAAYAW